MKRFSIDPRQWRKGRVWAYFAALALACATVALTQQLAKLPGPYGTTSSPTFSPSQFSHSIFLPIPPPPTSFSNASYQTGGIALRNRGSGTIHISGTILPIHAAFLYWAVIQPNANSHSMHIQNNHTGAVVTVTGTIVGVGPPPCWPGTLIDVYRAQIPAGLVTGNGSYELTLGAGAGSTAGEDPWVAPPVFPLWEGASMVVIGSGSGTVALYDVGLAGQSFVPPYFYTLLLPTSPTGALTLWDSIGADGQVGYSRTTVPGLSGENTFINGVPVSGPAASTSGDWDGSAGLPIPQLWDNTGHNVTAATPPGGIFSLNVAITGNEGPYGADCLTPVANVVEIH